MKSDRETKVAVFLDLLESLGGSFTPVLSNNKSGPCHNCGHDNPHNSPAGSVDDACNEKECNCGYYTPVQPMSETDRRNIDRRLRTMSEKSSSAYTEDSHGSIRRITPKLFKKERRRKHGTDH